MTRAGFPVSERLGAVPVLGVGLDHRQDAVLGALVIVTTAGT